MKASDFFGPELPGQRDDTGAIRGSAICQACGITADGHWIVEARLTHQRTRILVCPTATFIVAKEKS